MPEDIKPAAEDETTKEALAVTVILQPENADSAEPAEAATEEAIATPEVKEEPASDAAIEEPAKETEATDAAIEEPAEETEATDAAIEEPAEETEATDAAIEEPSKEAEATDAAIEDPSKEAEATDAAIEDPAKEAEATDAAIGEDTTDEAIKGKDKDKTNNGKHYGQLKQKKLSATVTEEIEAEAYKGFRGVIDFVWDMVFNGGKKMNANNPKNGKAKKQLETSIELAGMLPEETTADVARFDVSRLAEDAAENAIMAYDITLYVEDEEYQPEEPVTVTVSNELIAAAVENGKSLSVWHVEADGSLTEVDGVVVDGNTITFDAASFSVYIIKEHEDGSATTPRITYHFIDHATGDPVSDGNGGYYYEAAPFYFDNMGTAVTNDKQCTLIVKNGDTLDPVPTPPNATIGGKVRYFYGWYKVTMLNDNGSTISYKWPEYSSLERVDFIEGTVVNGITEDADVYLAPLYTEYSFVAFHENIKDPEVADNLLLNLLVPTGSDEEISIPANVAEAPQASPTKLFYGWKKDGDSTIYRVYDDATGNKLAEPDNIIVTESIDVYPEFMNAYWLNFVTGRTGSGASYVGQRFILQNNDLHGMQFEVPTWYGYTFNGLY